MDELSEHLTLAQAARVAPGNPSPNCLWRWCRRGVKARSGKRVRLRHVRIGGMIYTTADWIEEFGRRLAEADAEHFDLPEEEYSTPMPRRRRGRDVGRQAHIEQVKQELAEAGI